MSSTSDAGLTLLIDNYDSFTYNIFQELSMLGANVKVYRNDEISLSECIKINPRNIVISPGPGAPFEAGISKDVIEHFTGKLPILGVCLGHQCMVELFGGKVVRAVKVMHGKTSPITHDNKGLFAGLPQGFQATRYHSLVGEPESMPDCLQVTAYVAENDQKTIQGVRHKKYTVEGVQFHPESVCTEGGKTIFANFLEWNGPTWDEEASGTTNLFNEELKNKKEKKRQRSKSRGE